MNNAMTQNGNFGVGSMTAPLKRVALRKPSPALLNADPAQWHYGPLFERDQLAKNHQDFTSLLTKNDIDISFIEGDDQGIADSVFTYDASLMTPQGAILMSPGKLLRRGEQELHRQFYHEHGIPIVGEISGAATAEAGDTLWIDPKNIVIGRGFRTNSEGVRQLSNILNDIGVTCHAFDLPVFQGREACLHLMSLISFVDTHIALICKPLLPVALYQLLKERNIELLEAPYDEFIATGTLSTNILAIAPGRCVMLDGIPKTRAVLEKAGIDVQTFQGNALCIACESGPTCLTRPILRQ